MPSFFHSSKVLCSHLNSAKLYTEKRMAQLGKLPCKLQRKRKKEVVILFFLLLTVNVFVCSVSS